MIAAVPLADSLSLLVWVLVVVILVVVLLAFLRRL